MLCSQFVVTQAASIINIIFNEIGGSVGLWEKRFSMELVSWRKFQEEEQPCVEAGEVGEPVPGVEGQGVQSEWSSVCSRRGVRTNCLA